jgi:hypothetical protein
MQRMTMRKGVFAAGIVGIVLVATNGCAGYAAGTGSPLAAAIGDVACPELRSGAMNASFDEDARANATIRAFVTASGDLAETAARVQADVFMACERMANDLGIDDAARRPKNDQDSKVAASCNAVAARIDAIMKQGATARVRADVTPPQCQVNASAEASCRAQCNAQGSASGNAQGQAQNNQASGSARGTASADARCESSCKAHADLTAQCSEPRVNVQAEVNTGEIGKVVATLQRNLPPLIKAQVAYGQRIAGDVQVLVQTGAELPRAFGTLTAKAGSCVAAAANASVSAQASLRVSVQASASVSAKAGASTGS